MLYDAYGREIKPAPSPFDALLERLYRNQVSEMIQAQSKMMDLFGPTLYDADGHAARASQPVTFRFRPVISPVTVV